jgi:hypothetical protein
LIDDIEVAVFASGVDSRFSAAEVPPIATA